MTRVFFKILIVFLFIINLSSKNLYAQTRFLSTQSKDFPSFADLIEDLLPSVVNISTSSNYNNNRNKEISNSQPYFDERPHLDTDSRNKISSIGSGFIISSDGYIVTNSHVIEDSNNININLHDGSKYKAKIIGVDKKTDLALLKINSNNKLKFVKFGDSNKSRIGDWAIVIGNPYGLGGSVSIGIISARGRDINSGQLDEYIQTDAAINKGNSGGPLFNIKGEVIGINSVIFSPSGGSVGIGFATPSSNAIQIINQLKEDGEVHRSWIGVSVQNLTDEMANSLKLDKIKGAFVSDVVLNGPAFKAGILPTDIIINFNDQSVDDVKSLTKIVNRTPINDEVKIQVWRNGKIISLNLVVEKYQNEKIPYINNSYDSKPFDKKLYLKSSTILGINLTEYKNNNIEGLLVNDVMQKSEAFEKGILVGDIILSVNQNNISSLEALTEIINNQSTKNKKIFLFLKRNNKNFAVVLNIK